MSAFVITTVAEKGGVGKTTLTTHLATLFAATNWRVLVIDMDKQGDLSAFFLGRQKVHALTQLQTVAAIIDHEYDPEPELVVHESNCENIWIAPAHKQVLGQFSLPEQYWRNENEYSLRDFIDEVRDDFDIVFIDTHPDVDTLPTWVTLLAADYVITPVEPEEYSAHSTVAANARIKQAMGRNPRLEFLGFIVNKFQTKRKQHHRVCNELIDYHGELVFSGALGNYNELTMANNNRISLEIHKPNSPAAGVMRGFAEQIAKRIKDRRELRKVA